MGQAKGCEYMKKYDVVIAGAGISPSIIPNRLH